MAGKPSVLPRIAPSRVKVLLYFIPLFGMEFAAITAHQTVQFIEGIGALYIGAIFVAAASFAVGNALRGRVIWMRIGTGPTVDRSVVGDRLVVRRALPISVSGLILPRPEKFGRDWRLIGFVGLAMYAIVFAVGAVVLPGYAALPFCWTTALIVVLTLSARDPLTGRRFAARVFMRPTPQTDPVLTNPLRIAAERAAIDAQFGDFIAAERVLTELRPTPGAEEGAALLTIETLVARGEFRAALGVEVPVPTDASPALTQARAARHHARAAKLLLLAAECDPSLTTQNMPAALEHLKALATTPFRATGDRNGRALYALQAGDTAAALREARICLALARTPLTTADAMCTLAAASSVRGKGKQARAFLDQAARIAPWYPRLTTVQRLISLQTGAANLPVIDAAADTSAVFDDPWSAPSRD